MATFKEISDDVSGFRTSYGVISGTVKKSTAGIARKVLAFKNNSKTAVDETLSDASTGAFSLTLEAGDNDRFRIIGIGQDGENADVKDKVVAI